MIPKIILCILLLVTLARSEECTAGGVLESFKTSDNSIVRKKIIQDLFTADTRSGVPIPEWKIELLVEALHDKSPIVVESAINQLRTIDATPFLRDLTILFKEAESRFGTYTNRLRVALIEVFGYQKDRESTRVLAEFLSLDMGSDIAGDLLQALKRIDDRSLLPVVREFYQKMQLMVFHLQMRQTDPLLLGRYKLYAQLAQDVEQSLQGELQPEMRDYGY